MLRDGYDVGMNIQWPFLGFGSVDTLYVSHPMANGGFGSAGSWITMVRFWLRGQRQGKQGKYFFSRMRKGNGRRAPQLYDSVLVPFPYGDKTNHQKLLHAAIGKESFGC